MPSHWVKCLRSQFKLRVKIFSFETDRKCASWNYCCLFMLCHVRCLSEWSRGNCLAMIRFETHSCDSLVYLILLPICPRYVLIQPLVIYLANEPDIYTTDREEKNTFRMCSHIHRLVSKLKMDKKYVRNEKIIKIYIFSIHIMDFGLFMYHLLRRPQGIFESLIHRPFSSFSCPTW